MPLDVLGRTRATLIMATSNSPWPEGLGNLLKLYRAGDSPLQLLDFNEEFLVSVSHQLALITSLPLTSICLYVQGANSSWKQYASLVPKATLSNCGDFLKL